MIRLQGRIKSVIRKISESEKKKEKERKFVRRSFDVNQTKTNRNAWWEDTLHFEEKREDDITTYCKYGKPLIKKQRKTERKWYRLWDI